MFTLLFTFLLVAPILYFETRLRSTPIRFLVCIHTIFLLHNLVVHPPPNLFERLHLPLSTPTDAIRSILLKHSTEPNLPAHLERLLGRMNSFDTRTLYIRFGHDAVSTCEYCHSYWDFAFYALPTVALAYIRQAAVMGVVTIRGTGREHFRSAAMILLVAIAGVETYIRSTAVIQIREGESVFMWSDMLSSARVLIFALLPLVVEFLLPRRVPLAQPHPAEVAMHHLVKRLHALKYYRGAIMRSRTLNESASAWWGRERREGERILADQRVQEVARGVGLPFDGPDPILRSNARNISREFVQTGLPPPVPNA